MDCKIKSTTDACTSDYIWRKPRLIFSVVGKPNIIEAIKTRCFKIYAAFLRTVQLVSHDPRLNRKAIYVSRLKLPKNVAYGALKSSSIANEEEALVSQQRKRHSLNLRNDRPMNELFAEKWDYEGLKNVGSDTHELNGVAD
ncbi:hypothetical protein BJ742DRAFT_735209 [Cladochytrium replicatum]|nr:hypothetical protein BJ742DRAFT_735209 [Cladochytrium replicatum]